MTKANIASGNDVVAVQVGQATGRRAEKEPKPSPAPKSTTSTTNIRAGNAQVGVQVDVVIGDLHL